MSLWLWCCLYSCLSDTDPPLGTLRGMIDMQWFNHIFLMSFFWGNVSFWSVYLSSMVNGDFLSHDPLASYQICKIAGCACAGNAGNVYPAPTSKETASWRSRHASQHVRRARAVMHVGIAKSRWRGKRFRHSLRMRSLQFYVSGKRPIVEMFTPSRAILTYSN